eukprot:gnl/MRDRNA2_/MRDRNA2_53436_c0_seq1.p1 gnl/MRDRNA2_/MRDRNA2_53436_c0~~gnl/MRDRNA2_/MRDRNA2_53436_c0_seq1.p1  ORF type:complete len:111 (+),score=13.04 gnl/MRDRNA2_/MRDRNA2_53436_c0_seq1:268-600(+)
MSGESSSRSIYKANLQQLLAWEALIIALQPIWSCSSSACVRRRPNAISHRIALQNTQMAELKLMLFIFIKNSEIRQKRFAPCSQFAIFSHVLIVELQLNISLSSAISGMI